MVIEPTRLDNILDLFFTSSPSQINKVEITPGFSDYNIVHMHTSLKPKTLKQNKRHILLYNKGDWESIKFGLKMFHEELSSIDLKQVDTNSLWLRFHNKLTELIDLYISKKISRKRCTSPWITLELRRLMRKRNRLFKKYKTFHSPMYLDHYKSLKHQIQREVRRLHSNYINSIITPLGIHNKKFWSYIKNLKKDTCNIPSLFVNGSEVLENQAKTEVFNDHFQSDFTREDTSRLPSKDQVPTNHWMIL